MKEVETSAETIRRVLSAYCVGEKIRKLRLRKKTGLAELGQATGLSASMLSQLENGKLIPTLPTLGRIANHFKVGLEYFFTTNKSGRTFSIIRAPDRIRLPELPDEEDSSRYYYEVLTFGIGNRSLSAYLADFLEHATEQTQDHSHDGSEFVHVLEGVLGICYDKEDHVLNAGDSVHFDARELHSYRGLPSAKAIVITSPTRL